MKIYVRVGLCIENFPYALHRIAVVRHVVDIYTVDIRLIDKVIQSLDIKITQPRLPFGDDCRIVKSVIFCTFQRLPPGGDNVAAYVFFYPFFRFFLPGKRFDVFIPFGYNFVVKIPKRLEFGHIYGKFAHGVINFYLDIVVVRGFNEIFKRVFFDERIVYIRV